MHVPHFTDKSKVEQLFKKTGVNVISLGPAFYYSNWSGALGLKKAADGVFEWTLPLKPDTKLSAFAVEDTGLLVEATLANPDAYVGKCAP